MAVSTLIPLAMPAEVAKALGERLRALRLLKGWTRQALADRAGVSAASLKRFEVTGRISLESLLKLALALDRLEEFGKLLQPPPAQSLAELEGRTNQFTRKRGRR